MFFYPPQSVTLSLWTNRQNYIQVNNIANYRNSQIPGGPVAKEPLMLYVAAVLSTLEYVVNGNDGRKAAEAKGILLQVKSFNFVLCLVIFDRRLSC